MTSASATPTRPPRPRRALRRARWLLAPLVLLLVLAALTVDLRPRIANPGPPDALAASRTRDVADSLRALVATRAADGSWSATEDEVNAVLASAQRLLPGSFGVARIGQDTATIELAVGAPLMPAGLWLNVHLGVAASEDGVRLASARIGRLPIPPALAREGLRLALDRKLGDDLGTDTLAHIAALRLDPPQATVVFDSDPAARTAFFDRLRERALDAAGATAREQVYVQLWNIDRAAARGDLPRHGTLLPYLSRAVRIAARLAAKPGADPREEMRGALYALALYCGDPDFGDQIGVSLSAEMQGRGNGCAGTTLGGRDDLKRHFVISAGLQAATASEAAFGMGELKELLDSNEGGSGFSFRDMVADAAGVRFARTLLAAPPGEWKPMLALLDGEDAILPAFEDLPEHLTDAEFRARFGDVDSAAYAAMVAEIEARVDVLPFFAATAPQD
jgi:uncharacterized protein YfiM (DUF2279 family)